MEKTVPVDIDPGDCMGSLKDVLERLKFANVNGITLTDYTVSADKVVLTLKIPD